ncbi:MAG: hypothetical protein JSW00_00535 [Thermoplasmata archaeon]|nr:MAG: hypothetical protein JSW00_00535 [Thermoplasmata archaeon]
MVSIEIMENIDLEEGKIRIKGKWLTEDEIRYAIKMKVSSDDYNVADLAVALQTLITEMNKSTVLKVRVPKTLAEEFENIGKERDETVETVLRNILMDYISGEGEESENPYEEEETEVYEEVEVEPSSEIVRGVVVDEVVESEPEEYISDDRDEEIEIGIDEDERDEELLHLENTDEDTELEDIDIEEDLGVEDLPEFQSTQNKAKEKMDEVVGSQKKKKAAKKKTIIRRKKLRQKIR